MAMCEKCGFPMTEIIGVYKEEPKREERKVCLNCLRKKAEELEKRVDDLERDYRANRRWLYGKE